MEDKRELQLEGKKGGGKRTDRRERALKREKKDRHRERMHTAGKKHKTDNRRSKNRTKT